MTYFVFAIAAVVAVAAILIWVVRSREIQQRVEQVNAPPDQAADKYSTNLPTGDGTDPGLEDPVTPEITPKDFNQNPDAFMRQITQALNDLDMERFQQLSGESIDPNCIEALRQFATKYKAKGLQLQSREVGETEAARGYRWAIEAAQDAVRDRVYFDLRRGPDGWVVEKITLPGEKPGGSAGVDALGAAEAFLLAVLGQNFEEARQYADGGKLSDARIAGLCILFEEGEYQLRKQKPLRLLLQRENFSSYLATVVATDGSEAAQFGLNLQRRGEPAAWKVTEINLDKLLADYAQRVAGGDVYYCPLVRNPEGGDTLALYFGFDEDVINPRTRRQLEIVASILKADPVKKLTLSGHTDSKGTDAYNKSLSKRRAVAVKDFLLDAGVQAGQVVTLAMGDSEPRRPNVTETGEDDPDGRRANRRTEIYLDF